MKNIITNLARLSAVVLVVAGANFAHAAIANTPHNLGSTGTGPNTLNGTTEICVFCHTPHGADTAASVPLWNRVMAAPATYTTYDTLGTSSLDGAVAEVGSVSLACLSCHDGAQAMNAVINQPGSGLANDANFNTPVWTGSDRPTGIALLGTDLTNDHPVGIQYAGGGVNATTCATDGACSGALNDADFKQPERKTLNSNPVWWVELDLAAGRGKGDIQLYTRDAATVTQNGAVVIAGGVQPYVECASCHDPHSETVTFLRQPNTGSQLCLACHTK